MTVIFPDIEKVLVAGLKAALAARVEPIASNVYVATKKPAPDFTPYPSKIVQIRADGGPQLDDVRKTERIGVNVWCATYADANELSYFVAALMKTLTGDHVKFVNMVLSPIRIDEASTEEHRYLTFELVVKASTL